MTAHEKPMKPVKLAIDNAADVVPRVISAQGKACGGEFGLVLLPRQAAGIAHWRSGGVDERAGSAGPGLCWRRGGGHVHVLLRRAQRKQSV